MVASARRGIRQSMRGGKISEKSATNVSVLKKARLGIGYWRHGQPEMTQLGSSWHAAQPARGVAA